MALEPGARLGPYEILSAIGAGGMGEVYRAKDTRLDRFVAIKVLPHGLAARPQARTRFEREARAISQLNHPHICTLFDVGQQDGTDYLVMEFLDGETLAERLARSRNRALPLDQAFTISIQIADALDAAHRQGIVHRDLKPANVMLTKSGAKLLDFGIARMRAALGMESESSGQTATAQATLTAEGTLLGTLHYMSPEQLEGREADARSDLFAFGCVLYETLTSRRAFAGESPSNVIAAVLDSVPPPVATAEPQTPPALDYLVKTCLAKNPDDRWQSAGDLKRQLQWIAAEPATSTRAAATGQRPGWSRAGWLVAVGALLIWWIGHRASSDSFLGADASMINLADYTGTERSGAISPDGKFFAFVSNRGGQPDIWVRQVSGGDPVQITHDSAAKLDLVYAPDGETIYYSTAAAPWTIWRVGVLGGTARKIVEYARYPGPSPDGKRLAYVSRGEAIYIANADGTEGRQIASVPLAQYPQWSPDGRRLAYTSGSLFDTYQIHIMDQDGKNHTQLTSFVAGTVGCVAWLPGSRRIVFAYSPRPSPDSADLFAVTIDSREIHHLTLVPKGAFTSCSVSADGKKLAGAFDQTEWEVWKVPLGSDPVSNGKAAVRLLDRAWEPMWIQVPRAGTLLFNSPATGIRNLWVLPLAGPGAPQQVTFLSSANISHAALSPDGARVAYATTESGNGQIWVANSDGSGARQLTSNTATNFWPFWSPDGQWVGFTSLRPGPAEIWKVPAAGGTPVQITHSNGFRGDWSPDGGRIAYDTAVLQGSPREREQTSRLEIAEASTGKVLRTLSPRAVLASPVWSPDGKRLSATAGNSVWMIDPETAEARPAIQFPQGFVPFFRAAWTPDGQSIIVNRQERPSHIVMLENFWKP